MLFYTFQYKPDTICPLIMSESEFFFKERHRTNINLAATFKDFKNRVPYAHLSRYKNIKKDIKI